MNQRIVSILDLQTETIFPGEWIVVAGTATGNVKIDNKLMPTWADVAIIDLSQATIPEGYNVQIRNCSNIIVNRPSVNMGAVDDHAIKVEMGCDSVVINDAYTDKGQNGIFIIDGSKNSIIYRSVSENARIDGMSCHAISNGSIPCGNSNAFIECESGALNENGFDLTSGQSHLMLDCKVLVNGSNNGIHVGHGASARIVNMNMPAYKIEVKETAFLEIMGSLNIKQLVFRSQSGGGLPQNVKWFGPEPKAVGNIENLNLSSFYSVELGVNGFIPSNIRTKIAEKLDTVHQYLY